MGNFDTFETDSFWFAGDFETKGPSYGGCNGFLTASFRTKRNLDVDNHGGR